LNILFFLHVFTPKLACFTLFIDKNTYNTCVLAISEKNLLSKRTEQFSLIQYKGRIEIKCWILEPEVKGLGQWGEEVGIENYSWLLHLPRVLRKS